MYVMGTEKLKDTKEVIRSCKSKENREQNGNRKGTLKIELCEPHKIKE